MGDPCQRRSPGLAQIMVTLLPKRVVSNVEWPFKESLNVIRTQRPVPEKPTDLRFENEPRRRARDKNILKMSPPRAAEEISRWKSPGDARFTEKHPDGDRFSRGGRKFILTATRRRAAEGFSG